MSNDFRTEGMEPYVGLADAKGYVYFTREFRWSHRKKYYRYHVNTGIIHRVYASNFQRAMHDVFSQPAYYVETYNLKPIIPKHLQMDIDL